MKRTYYDLNAAVFANKLEAIEELKTLDNMEITFCEDTDEPYGDEPYVILDKGSDGELTDNMVIKVRYNEKDGIEILVDKDWLPISQCLGYTENNVYAAILNS